MAKRPESKSKEAVIVAPLNGDFAWRYVVNGRAVCESIPTYARRDSAGDSAMRFAARLANVPPVIHQDTPFDS